MNEEPRGGWRSWPSRTLRVTPAALAKTAWGRAVLAAFARGDLTAPHGEPVRIIHTENCSYGRGAACDCNPAVVPGRGPARVG